MNLFTLNKLANELSTESLFTSGGTLHPTQIKEIFAKSWKYDCGKYAATSKGKPVDANVPVWYVTRSDSNGSYIQLITVDERLLTVEQMKVFKRIVSIWLGV